MTLTEFTYYFRKLLPFILIVFILFVVFYFFIIFYLKSIEPKKIESLSIKPIFGKINKPIIGKTATASSDFKFILDTIEGKPKTATLSAKVFFLPPKTALFGYLSKIYLIAKSLDFNTEIVRHKIKDKKAVFEDEEKKFTVDIANFNFEYQYKYENNAQLFENVVLPENEDIKEKVRAFLRITGRNPEELARGRENLIYLIYDISSNQFKQTLKKQEANAVKIDFFRPDIDNFPIVSPNYFTSQNFVILTSKDGQDKILKAQIKYFEKEDQQVGIYPLKSAEEVWQDLKNNRNFIISADDNQPSIIIKKMFLGYFDPDIDQDYLQPVYVFLGDEGFVAYVSAVKNEYTKQN